MVQRLHNGESELSLSLTDNVIMRGYYQCKWGDTLPMVSVKAIRGAALFQLPDGIARSRREDLHPWQRSWGRRLDTQRRDRASGVPLEILEHLPPKPESAYFTTLCFHLHLWFYRGLSPTTSFREGVNLELQLIIIPGRDRSVPNLQTPLKVF